MEQPDLLVPKAILSFMRFCGLLLCALFLFGCANIVPPTGGPRDAEPPALVKSTPQQGAIHFKNRYIKLEFDEYIKLQNQANVRVTPALPEKPVFIERFNTLTIDLGEKPLEPNTTYTINFGDALTDLNENNKFQNLRYVFSTGSYLDSLSIQGKVVDAIKRLPYDQALVALYPIDNEGDDDSLVFKRKPFYFLKTDKSGVYSLENLRAGNYRLLAFDDKDNNLLYKITEPVGFADSLIAIDTSNKEKPYDLVVFENTSVLLKLVERRSIEPGTVRLRFSVPVDSVHLNFLDPNDGVLRWQLMGDSAFVFHQALEKDTLRFLCHYNSKADTVVVVNRKLGEGGLKPLNIGLAAGNQPSVLEPLNLRGSRPIVKIDTSLIRWKEDTVLLDALATTWELKGSSVQLTPNIRPNKRYEIFLEKGALIDWLGVANDTFRFTFNSLSIESFGDLIFEGVDSIPTRFTHLQLLDEQYQLLYTLKLDKKAKLAFKQLRPVGYRLRLLVDANGNEKWDSGDFTSRRQPEELWYYPEVVKLRANWEIEVNLSAAGRK